MALFNNRDDDQDRDYFEEIPDEEPKKREPVYAEDDPRYWDKDDDRWEHLRPRRKMRLALIVGAAVLLIALCVVVWLRYFKPSVSEAVQYGYIESIQTRGIIFNTDEGVLLPYKAVMDTTRPYDHDFVFSAADAKVAADLRRFESRHLPVRVTYKVYNATVPWRGASKIVVTRVDSVCADSIMPPGWQYLNH